MFALASFAAFQISELKETPPSTKLLPSTNDPKEISSQIFIGQMTGSQLVQNSSNISIKAKYDAKGLDFKQLIAEIKEAIPKLGLEPQPANQLHADIGTIEVQIGSPLPKPSVITESLHSIRNILEGMAGSILASQLLLKLQAYLSF